MADATFKIIVTGIEDEDGNPITSGPSPIACRDHDESIAWVEGTWQGNGDLVFNIPSGLPSGIKWGVQTASGVFTDDAYLSGILGGDGSANKGIFVVPVNTIQV